MGQRILSVDDNEIVGWTLAARLWVAGYDVETVASAAAAFEALKVNQYDLVLLDLEMPDCGGLEALDFIRRQDLCLNTPVVLLTSSEYFGHVQKAYTLGASGYLTKSFASNKLIKTIDRLMKGDDVVWIDDLHCVSKQPRLDSILTATATTEPPNAPVASRRPSAPRHLTLVSTSHDPKARTLEAC